MLWKMSPAWQREAGGPYNPGKMAVAARSPELSHPTEMPRDLAVWGSARRAPWRLPRASISRPRSPRTLGGVRSAMSPTGETPPGRRQGGKSKRLRNQAEIFSVCFQQEPHVNKVLLLFVAHAYCALAESRSMLPHTIVAAVCNASYSMQCCLFANIHTLLVLYLPMTA
jgi:hypothetical protein